MSVTTPLPPHWSDAVLAFWFGELAPEQWFKTDAGLDTAIRARFLASHEAVAASGDAALLATPDTALAAVIALDQFPRNMFRATPRAFATDAKALGLAAAAVGRGDDQALDSQRRLFLYLPFEHSEHAGMQVRSLALITALGDATLTKYAMAHKVIIDRFGRFPHRNAILGRPSSAEEAAFLLEPMSSF